MAASFISILKSIGNNFRLGIDKALALEAKALPAEEEAASVVSAVNPAVGATLSAILGEIGQVEQVATAVGSETGTGQGKLAAALPAVEKIILSDPLFAGKTIPNLATYNTAVEDLVSAVVDLANSFETAVPATPAPTK